MTITEETPEALVDTTATPSVPDPTQPRHPAPRNQAAMRMVGTPGQPMRFFFFCFFFLSQGLLSSSPGTLRATDVFASQICPGLPDRARLS